MAPIILNSSQDHNYYHYLEGCQSDRKTAWDEFRDEFFADRSPTASGILAAMGDSERRKRKLRERQTKERQRQEQRRVKVADARAQERAEDRRLLEEDRKLIEAHRPSEAEYEAKLVLLRSTKPADRESFFDDLLDHPDKYFDLDDMLDFFALELANKTSDDTLRKTLQDPNLRWFEQIEEVERAGLAEDADLLRALVRAADYPVTRRQEQEEQETRWRTASDAVASSLDAKEATGPSAKDWIASLAPLSSGSGRLRRPRS